MNSITLTPSTHSTWSTRSNLIAPHCWCGQDLEYVHQRHCPRCGTARVAEPPPLARAS